MGIVNQRHRMNSDSQSCTDRIHAFVGLPLYRNGADRHTKKFRKPRAYDIYMRTQFRLFAYYRGINVANNISGSMQFLDYRRKEHRRLRPFPARIGVRKVRPNIPKCRCAENGINHGMDENICIGMAFKLRTSRNLGTSQLLPNVKIQSRLTGLFEPVRIISESNSHVPICHKAAVYRRRRCID